jgi:WXG100 family type VII secretion target
MAHMTTDAAVLSKEAANFERIADELKSIVARVEATAADLDNHWQGAAARAAQSAIQRFHEAASAQINQLNDISNNIAIASARYSGTDDEHAGKLAAAMSMGGPDGANGREPSGSAVRPQSGGIHAVDFKQDGGPQPPSSPGTSPAHGAGPAGGGLPAPLQDYQRYLQGLAPLPTPRAPFNADQLKEQVKQQLEAGHDEYLKQLIADASSNKCTTHDVIRGLTEFGIADASALGGGLAAPWTGGVSLYLGLAAALASGG